MKVFSYMLMVLCALVPVSCTTERQFHGTVAGSMVGGMFGSSIGGLMGGWRGSDAGTVAGMLIGGAVGSAVTDPRTRSNVDEPYEQRSDDVGRKSRYEYLETPLDDVVIEELRFIDTNHNRRLDAEERCKFIFHLYNRGDRTVYDVTPLVTSDAGKRIIFSPPAIVSHLEPGQGVRYTIDVYGRSRLRRGQTTFRIDLSDGQHRINKRVFSLPTGGR